MKFIFPLFALLFALPASAQTDAVQARTFRVASTAGVYTDLFYDLKGGKTSIFASAGGLSVPFACPSSKTLSLYRELPPPAGSPPDTKPTKQVVAEVSLPVDWKKSIVILSAAPASAALPIIGVAIEELPKEHTTGTFRVFNLSSYPAAFGLEDKVIPLSPQASTVVPFSPGVTDVKVAVQAGTAWRSVYGNERRLDANLRGYCVVVNSKPVDAFSPPAQALMLLDYVRPPTRRQ